VTAPGAEDISIDLAKRYLDVFYQELGFEQDELELAKAMVSHLIEGTIFVKPEADYLQLKMKLFDQTGDNLFNKKAVEKVMGLLNEERVQIEEGIDRFKPNDKKESKPERIENAGDDADKMLEINYDGEEINLATFLAQFVDQNFGNGGSFIYKPMRTVAYLRMLRLADAVWKQKDGREIFERVELDYPEFIEGESLYYDLEMRGPLSMLPEVYEIAKTLGVADPLKQCVNLGDFFGRFEDLRPIFQKMVEKRRALFEKKV